MRILFFLSAFKAVRYFVSCTCAPWSNIVACKEKNTVERVHSKSASPLTNLFSVPWQNFPPLAHKWVFLVGSFCQLLGSLLNCHLILVEEFEYLNDRRSYVVGG